MRVRAQLKRIVEHRLGVRIYRELPLGTDVYHDLRRLPGWSPSGVILDVGANLGQTALALSAAFPDAAIHSFEPAPATFDELARRTAHLRNVRCHQFAFGSTPGSAEMQLHRKSDQSTLRGDIADAPGFQRTGRVTVEVRTIDGFLAEHGIGFVQYLKIDTEGFDLEVLKGAADALAAARVGLVEVEAGFRQDEGKFVPLEEFQASLRTRGYLLFGIYEQVRVHRQTRLRRCNAVFISDSFAEATAAVEG